MENSDYNNKLKQLEDHRKQEEECKKQEEELLRKKLEAKISREKEKIEAKILHEREKEIKRNRRELEKEVEKRQKEYKKTLEENAKLNKRRFDNDETYTWGELVMSENSFIAIEETKEIWVYSKKTGYYTPNGEVYLMKLCADGGPRTNDRFVLSQLKLFIMGKSFKSLDNFTHPENLINLKNGVLDMDKNVLLSKSPEYNFQNMLSINYDENAKCPFWETTLKEMFSSKDYIRTQKWFGYHLFKENVEQVMHGFVGESGSGKSIMLHILVELLGKENVTHFNLQDLNNRVNPYAIGRLYGKLANVTFDMITTPIKDGTFEIIKNLTSSDRINARNIREAPFEFIPHVKLTFACNKLPPVAENIINTEEFKRRMMLTKVKKKDDFKKDTELYSKFLIELRSGGIFNWILEGRKKYLDDQGFNYDHEKIPNMWINNIQDDFQDEKLTPEDIAKIEESNRLLNIKNQEIINDVIERKKFLSNIKK